MIHKIKSKFKSEDNKRLLSNFMSLSVLQGANYILPLITLPYLIRVLGVEYFGLLAFATALIAYFNIITDYGFNLTATREISIHRDDREKITEIFSSVMTIKIILMLVSFIFMTIIVFSFEKFTNHWEIYFLTFGTVVGQVLFPLWFFQGMERMKYITYLNILAKSIFTIAIFAFVQEESDFYLVPILTSIGFIVAGIYSLFLINKKFEISFKWQNFKTLKIYLVDGWDIFVSNIFGSLYRSSNVIILGLLTNNTFVGYYTIAEKIIYSLQMLQEVIGRTLFPYLSKKFDINKKIFFELNNKYFKYIFITYLILFIGIFTMSEQIVSLFVGECDSNIVYNLKIMSIVLMIGGLNYYYAILGLVAMNYKKEFSNYIMITGIFNLFSCFILVYLFNDVGASMSLVISETLLLSLLLFRIFSIKKLFLYSSKVN